MFDTLDQIQAELKLIQDRFYEVGNSTVPTKQNHFFVILLTGETSRSVKDSISAAQLSVLTTFGS